MACRRILPWAWAGLALAACDPVLEGPPPSLANPAPGALPVEPPIVCNEQHPDEGTAVVVHGEGFSPITVDIPNDPRVVLPDLALIGAHDLFGGDAELGTVSYDGELGGENAELLSWQSQAQLTFVVKNALTLPEGEGALSQGLYDLTVTNADAAAATSALAFAVADRPHVATLDPPLVCVAQGPRAVTVNGTGALRIGADGPSVSVDDLELTPTLSSCAPLAHPGLDAESCDALTIDLSADALASGQHAVVVTNPAPAACASLGDVVDLIVVPPPTIDAIEPTGVCAQTAGVVTLTVSGSDMLRVDGTDFTVTVAGTAATPTAITGCVPVTVAGLDVERCTGFDVAVDMSALPVGAVEVSVVNPDPAGCSVATAELFAVVPVPTITAVAPAAQCSLQEGPTDIVVTGVGFLRAGADFAVTFNGGSVTPSNITGCTDVVLPGGTMQSCTGFTLSVDTTGLGIGDVPIVVDNPDVRDCSGTANGVFTIAGPPTITGIVPDELCSDLPATTFDIVGTGFTAASAVTVGGAAPDTVAVNGAGTALTVTFADGLAAGVYDVTVSNGTGCDAAANAALTVNPTPLVFFVDPPVVYNGISLQVTVFASGLDVDGALSVELIDTADAVTVLTFDNPGRPSRVLADIPAGLTPGDYRVRVTSAEGCASSLDGRVTITDQLTPSIASVDPSFISPTEPTAVTIVAGDTLTFENLPRVYLSPTGGGDAIALHAVELTSGTQLSAVVAGAVPGTYDLIIVNPSGTVGFLAGAVTVTVAEPPIITSVAPGSLNKGQVSNVVVTGTAFDTATGPAISFACIDFDGGATVTPPSATVNTFSSTSLGVTIDAASLGGAAPVCVVVVTNPDGASFRYSAISFKEPAQNLNAFRYGSSMLEARRGLALLAGRPTATSRYLYAAGGDDGTATNVKTSVEAVPIDPFGAMGSFTAQRNDLSSAWDGAQTASLPRAFSGAARVGRFLYLVGGDDAAGPTSTLLRAHILDPLAGPEIVDLDAALGDSTTGMGPGLYLYRVSALFPTTDPSNPGGESLAGELFNVELPDVPELLVITLGWAPVTGASGYRVYRTPLPDQTADDLELMAELAGNASTTFVDDDTAAPDPATTPMPHGSLGVWHVVPGATLGTPRAAPATVAVASGTAGQFYLYAVGGRTGVGTVTGSGEVATVTIAGDQSQTVSAWRPLTASLNPARAEAVALSIAPGDTPVAGANTFLFFACGRRANTTVTNVTEGATLGANGDLTAFTGVQAANPARVGAAGLGANGFLFLFGGSGGGASNNDVSTSLLDATPTLDNWNALGGGSMQQTRVSHAAAQESAFFFVGGGYGAGDVPLSSIEQTVQ